MKRIVRKFRNFKEAESWDIEYQINMTPEQRFEIAEALKKRVYGDKPDVRASVRR